MSNGQEYTLDQFGWSGSQTPSQQWSNFQSALDSGEPLLLPVNETVQVDQPLVMQDCPSLKGWGPDVTYTGNARSAIRKATPDFDALTILGNHCKVENFDIAAPGGFSDGQYTGSGIVVGNASVKALGVKIDRVSTHPYNKHGIHVQAMAKSNIDRSWLYGKEAAIRLQNVHGSDDGDNSMYGNRVFGGSGFQTNSAYGLHWTSGGGLYIAACKFLFGVSHIYMDWNEGGSGNLTATGCSFESNDHISVDMRGEYPFKRAHFSACTWGGVLLALAVRNFSPTNWLESLIVEGCTADTEFANGNPVLDIGCTKNALIGGNTLNGKGGANYGIITRSGSHGVLGANQIVDCGGQIRNDAGWATI